MMKEVYSLIAVIYSSLVNTYQYTNCMQHFQNHCIHLKTTKEIFLLCKLFDIKSVIKISLISLGFPFYLRAK